MNRVGGPTQAYDIVILVQWTLEHLRMAQKSKGRAKDKCTDPISLYIKSRGIAITGTTIDRAAYQGRKVNIGLIYCSPSPIKL